MRKRTLLTMKEACQYLGVSRATLLKTEEEELITPVRTVGGHRRYSTVSLNQVIRATKSLRTSAGSSAWGKQGHIVLPRIVEKLAQHSKSTDEMMKEVLRDMIKFLQVDAGLIALLDDKNMLCPQVAVGLPKSFELSSTSIPSDDTLSGRVLQLQRSLVYDDSEGDVLLHGMTRGICAPLIYQGISVGVIHVLSVARRQFLPTEIRFLSLVALYLAGLIVNSQLLVDSKRREEELSCLNRINQIIQKQQDWDSTANVLLKETLSAVEADAGIVFLCKDTGDIHIASIVGDLAGLDSSLVKRLKTVVTSLLDSKEPYLVLSPSQRSAYGLDLGSILDKMKSVVLVPLRSQGETLGVIQLCSRSPRKVNDWQMPFLHLLCAQTANTIQRATLYERLYRKSEEERLLRNCYERMIAKAPVAMEIIDRNNKIIAWNAAMEKVTGIPQEEALGADKFLLQPKLLKPGCPSITEMVRETKQIHKARAFPYEQRDGTVRYADLTFLPFVNDAGDVTAIIVFAQDIAEFEEIRAKVHESSGNQVSLVRELL